MQRIPGRPELWPACFDGSLRSFWSQSRSAPPASSDFSYFAALKRKPPPIEGVSRFPSEVMLDDPHALDVPAWVCTGPVIAWQAVGGDLAALRICHGFGAGGRLTGGTPSGGLGAEVADEAG